MVTSQVRDVDWWFPPRSALVSRRGQTMPNSGSYSNVGLTGLCCKDQKRGQRQGHKVLPTSTRLHEPFHTVVGPECEYATRKMQSVVPNLGECRGVDGEIRGRRANGEGQKESD